MYKSKINKWLVSVNYNKTDQDYREVQQKAEECFQKWCEEEEFIDSGNSKCAAVLCLHVCVSNICVVLFKLYFYFMDLVEFIFYLS